jgi:hypothetical protein
MWTATSSHTLASVRGDWDRGLGCRIQLGCVEGVEQIY